MDTFIKLGKQWDLDPDTHTELEEFTCTMYGHPRLKEVNKVRSSMMRKITGGNTTAINKVKKVDLSRIPPCKRSLTPHCNRVNYRVAQWKLAHEPKPNIEKPTEKHGWTKENGLLEPLWSDGPVLPSSLHEVLESKESEPEDADQTEEDIATLDESDYASSSDSETDS